MKRCLSQIYGPTTPPSCSQLEVRLAHHYHATHHCHATSWRANFPHVHCAPNLPNRVRLSKAMVVVVVVVAAPSLHQSSPEAVVVMVVVATPSLKTLA